MAVTDVIEVGLDFLPVMCGHERRFFMKACQHLQNAAVEFLDHVGMQQHLPGGTNHNVDEFAFVFQTLHQFEGLVGSDIGSTHQVGLSETSEAPKPGHSQSTLRRAACPELFDTFQNFEMPTTHFFGNRLQHLTAAKRQGGR